MSFAHHHTPSFHTPPQQSSSSSEPMQQGKGGRKMTKNPSCFNSFNDNDRDDVYERIQKNVEQENNELAETYLEQPSIQSAKDLCIDQDGYNKIENLFLKLNSKVDNISSTICIYHDRLKNLENLFAKLNSNCENLVNMLVKNGCPSPTLVMKGSFDGGIEGEKNVPNTSDHDTKHVNSSKIDLEDDQRPSELVSQPNSPFIENNLDNFPRSCEKGLGGHANKNFRKMSSQGILNIFENFNFQEPKLPRGLEPISLAEKAKSTRKSPSNKRNVTSNELRTGPIKKKLKEEDSNRPEDQNASLQSSIGIKKKVDLDHNVGKEKVCDKLYSSMSNSIKLQNKLAHTRAATPTSLFKQYLHRLDAEEAQICVAFYEWENKKSVVYSHYHVHWRMCDVQFLFPDLELSNDVIDMFSFDLGMKTRGRKLHMPSHFQFFVDGRLSSAKILDNFISRDVDPSLIEEVCIPVLQSLGEIGHWFFIVINLCEKRWYLLDSLGPTEERKDLARTLLAEASKKCVGDAHLGRVFKDVLDFEMDVPNINKQTNGYDCGMFVIKYMEAHSKSEWSEIRYGTEEMRVERLRYISKILRSPFNDCNKPYNFTTRLLESVKSKN